MFLSLYSMFGNLEARAGLGGEAVMALSQGYLVRDFVSCLAGMALFIGAGRAAEAISAADVKALQEKFQSERAAAQKGGSTSKFSPELFKQVDLLARQGEADSA